MARVGRELSSLLGKLNDERIAADRRAKELKAATAASEAVDAIQRWAAGEEDVASKKNPLRFALARDKMRLTRNAKTLATIHLGEEARNQIAEILLKNIESSIRALINNGEEE